MMNQKTQKFFSCFYSLSIRVTFILVSLVLLICIVPGVSLAASNNKKHPTPTPSVTPIPTPSVTPTPTPKPTPPPSFSGGVGVFFPITPLSEDNLIYWFTPKVQNAAALGLQFVNLIVHWKDLEPQANIYAFDMLGRYMQVIAEYGLKCVLRIYFNGGSYIQASPDWLFDQGATYCLEGNYIQPLPWDKIYQAKMATFMDAITAWMAIDSQRQPQAIQLSAGGLYGEMAVLGFDWQTTFQNDYDKFYELLTTANKYHVDVFAKFSKRLTSTSLILMINHLYDNNPSLDDLVMNYAAASYGLNWFQSNSWSGELQQQQFGTRLLDMMERHITNGLFSLEDESGANYESLAKRIDRMEQIQIETGVHFQSVSLNVLDLTAENHADILYLVSWTQNGKTQ